MSFRRILMLIVLVLVGSCGGDRETDTTASLPEASLPGVYSGLFPCADCPGITTALWLRSDGRYFFSQQYPAEDTRDAMKAYSLGRWRPMSDDQTIELSGAGPRRTFMRLDPDTLVMQTDSDLEHRLSRDPAAPRFSEAIRMKGVMRVRGNNVSFTECWTGFMAPVSNGRSGH